MCSTYKAERQKWRRWLHLIRFLMTILLGRGSIGSHTSRAQDLLLAMLREHMWMETGVSHMHTRYLDPSTISLAPRLLCISERNLTFCPPCLLNSFCTTPPTWLLRKAGCAGKVNMSDLYQRFGGVGHVGGGRGGRCLLCCLSPQGLEP